MQKLELKDMERCAMISWVIWNARNKLHFEKTQVPPKVIFDGAVGFLEGYQKLMIAQRVAQAFFPMFCFRTGLCLGLLYVYTFFNINIQYLLSKKKKKSLWNYNLSSKASLMIILKSSFCHKSNDTIKEPFTWVSYLH